MSVVLVDVNDAVYVATFTTDLQAVGFAATDATNVWVLRPLSEVPGINNLGLDADLGVYTNAFLTEAMG